MSDQLRQNYNKISQDYLEKKSRPWTDFVDFLENQPPPPVDIAIDVGAANGRNLLSIIASLPIALELSLPLLRGYIGPSHGSRVAGALPLLPFREKSADIVLLVAVIHHFRDSQLVIKSLKDTNRILNKGILYTSVWRKWRTELREKLINKISKGESIEDLINHDRPWYASDGSIVSTRFYHYYTYKELFNQLQKTNFQITRYSYSGGKFDDANIFIEAVPENF